MRHTGRPKYVPDTPAEEAALLEKIYLLFKNKENDEVNLAKFFNVLRSTGIRTTDPRLKKTIQHLHEAGLKRQNDNDDDADGTNSSIDKDTFLAALRHNLELIVRILRSDLVIPEMAKFRDRMTRMFSDVQKNRSGKNADYIPQLARVNPEFFGMSVCTVDGQRFSVGDVHLPFCLQSTSKALNYAIAVSDHGAEHVHHYIGQEPSGRSFNELTLDANNKPHNPMINAGAIICCSLLKPDCPMSERFDKIIELYKRMAGGEFVGFSNSTYLSERDTADRNFALAYYMKENHCFPDGADLEQTLQFYFQLCSVEATGESGAVIAATLANGGTCPITEDEVLKTESVRNCLSLMYSCGMYDYSGQFAFKVGLPGKSGVAGAVLLVVPNVMGVCIWSPRLDAQGNSVRGVQFCEELVSECNFHNFDNLKHTTRKWDPRRRESDAQASEVVDLLFGAAHGDLSALNRFAQQGMDMRQGDYDKRTALHLAAAEGHVDVVRFLLYHCHVPHDPRDRWSFRPIDDAKRFNHVDVVRLLEEYESQVKSGKVPTYEEAAASHQGGFGISSLSGLSLSDEYKAVSDDAVAAAAQCNA